MFSPANLLDTSQKILIILFEFLLSLNAIDIHGVSLLELESESVLKLLSIVLTFQKGLILCNLR